MRARLLAESGATEELARLRAEMLKASNNSQGAAKASEDALRMRLTDTEGQLAKYEKDLQALRTECLELQKKLADREDRETKLTQALVRERGCKCYVRISVLMYVRETKLTQALVRARGCKCYVCISVLMYVRGTKLTQALVRARDCKCCDCV